MKHPRRVLGRQAKAFWEVLKCAGSQWLEDKAARLGAALAYYSIFSIAPLLIIVIAIAGFVFGHQAVEGQVSEQIRDLVGEEGANAIQAMVANASKPGSGIIATVVGVAMLFLGATGLFGQLQDAMNTVWEVQPKSGRGILGILKDRLLSMSMVLGTAFLLLVSLVVSTALEALGGRLLGDARAGVLGQAINFAVSLVVITLLFAMIYRFLPDARIAWRDVGLGAAMTALLFVLGKWCIGLYLGQASVGSTYGAAGSLVVLLVWLYYSAQIFLFGAEFTKAYANRYGSRIVPTENAVPVTEKARAEQGIPRTPHRNEHDGAALHSTVHATT
jgi:membrane protein